MHFSIIIPTLNEEQTIVNCLNKLQACRDEGCEIIVVDGGSSDKTKEIALPSVDKLVESEKGRAIQMNEGAANASGNVLVFLHADTLLPDDALNLIAASINGEQQWGRFDVELGGSHPLLKVVAWFMNWRSRLTGIATGDQVIFINKQLFESIGGYPVIPLMEDIALCKNLIKITSPVCLKANVVSSGRRWEQNGVIKTTVLMWSLRLRYFLGADPQILAQPYYKEHNGKSA
jgi:rSAM/selenodomain-associated transferase 2